MTETEKINKDELDISLDYDSFSCFHDLAKKHELEYFLIRVSRSRSQGIIYEEKKTSDIFDDITEQYSVLTFKAGGYGFSYGFGNELESIKRSFEKSAKLANWTSKNTAIKFKIHELSPIKEHVIIPSQKKIMDYDIGEKIEFVKGEAKSAYESDTRIKIVSSVLKCESGHSITYNSFDRFIERSMDSLSYNSNVFANENSLIRSCHRRFSNRGGYELIDNCIGLSLEASKDAIELLSAKMITPGKTNLIIDPLLGGTFVHEAFGHACEADGILNNDSILEGKLGTVIAPDFVNITDGGAVPGLNGSYEYDSETVKSTNTYLVKNGVLNSYIHSLETAGRMGVEPTGNGRADGTFKHPLVRMSNTFLEPGDRTVEELLEGTEKRLFIHQLEIWLYQSG